ncbi:MAG: nucleotidyltransferase family protein [Polaromonas sp.]
MHPSLHIDESTLAQFFQAHHIRRLPLFGSRLKGTARPDGDIDLLVEFEAARTPTLFDMAAMDMEFSQLMGGSKIDLRTAHDLSRYFRAEVTQTAELQYAQ